MLCRWLGVSRSGFYAWEKRKASQRYHNDQKLLEIISRIYWESKGRYGSPRVYEALQSKGIYVSKKRVERLMREAGLVGRVTRVTRRVPGLRRFVTAGENRLLNMAPADDINQIWVADVTYIKVKDKWCYLATIMDQYSRRIIGWSLGRRRTTELTENALAYALKKRGNPTGVVFHTDRGIEFTNHRFQKLLKQRYFKHSVNRPGHCTDNAFMESFYHSFKAELIRGTIYKSFKVLRKSLGGYINKFYNQIRLHSGLNYQSPMDFEKGIA